MAPSLANTSRTVPPTVATMSFCIFIASRTTTTSPRRTLSPLATLTLTTMPCIGAWIAPSPPPRCAAVGPDAAAGAAAAPGATPSPRIRTRYGSPSTPTANSRPGRPAGGGAAARAAAGRRRNKLRLWRGGWRRRGGCLGSESFRSQDIRRILGKQDVGQDLVDPVRREPLFAHLPTRPIDPRL